MTDSKRTSRLVLSELSHSYGSFEALKRVSLELAGGQVHCLVGPSGSGKSTLLRCIAGLEVAQEGTIEIAGQRVLDGKTNVPTEQRSVGYMFQEFALFPHMTVARNVMFGMTGVPRTVRQQRACELLERVGMAESAEAMPHMLSGGQQQRVALARSLARQPAVMLLDEPFSSLDVTLRDEVREITLRLLCESHTVTMMVTHDPQEALVCGDVVSVIRGGRIVQTGSPLDLYERPADEATARMFGPMNMIPVSGGNGSLTCCLGPVSDQWALCHENKVVMIRPEELLLEIRSANQDYEIDGVIVRQQQDAGTRLITVDTAKAGLICVRQLLHQDIKVGENVAICLRGRR